MSKYAINRTGAHHHDTVRTRRGRSGLSRCYPRGACRLVIRLTLVLLCALPVGSHLSTMPQAEAQVSAGGLRGKRIETFVIDPASFSLVTNAVPEIDATDGATTYVLTASGSMTFNLLSGAQRTITLDVDDRIIERPFAGTVTVVRDR